MTRLCSLLAALCLFLGAVSCSDRPACRLSAKDARDPRVIENLNVLGRVWGYTKYHHPIFADSTVDVDQELLRLLPEVAHAEKPVRNRLLADWIDSLGAFSTAPERYDTLPGNTICDYHADLSWTHDTLRLGRELSDRLVQLRYADRDTNRYATRTHKKYKDQEFEIANVGFSNEIPYTEATDPDTGLRLLAAFRFWNMVEYFFPSKYMTSRPWDDVLPDYTARMISLPDGDYLRTMWRMIAEIGDSHAAVTLRESDLFGAWRVPAKTVWAEGRVVVAKPGAGLLPGDEIVETDGHPAAYYTELVRTYIPCSNETRVLDETAEVMLRTSRNKPLRISYMRDSIRHDTLMEVTHTPYSDRPVRYYPTLSDLGGGIGYLKPSKFTSEDEKQFDEMLANPQAVVVDMREYPGTEESWDAINRLVPDSLYGPLVCHFTAPVLSLPGTFFAAADPAPEWRRPHRNGFPILVLVDGGTQSAGESAVQHLQTSADVTVVGTQTAGANGNVSYIDLPGGIRTCFSGLGWYYNDGTPIQRRGVRIDILVRPTVEGVKAGRDEILDAAVRIIRTGNYPPAVK